MTDKSATTRPRRRRLGLGGSPPVAVPRRRHDRPTVLALMLGAALGSTPALAQHGGCPPGLGAIGGGNAGWVGCAPIYDPWQGAPINPDPTPSWARGPSIHPLAGRIAAATTLFEMEAARTTDLQRRLASDPEFARAYRRYTAGGWDLFAQQRRGQCAAMFSREGNILLMFETAGDKPGALLVFIGRGLPAPERPRTVRVDLRQNQDANAQSVKAFNYRMPQTERGAVAIATPTMAALVDNMLDDHSFELSIAGDKVFEIAWRDAAASRNALAQCVAGRRQPLNDPR